MKEVNLGKRLIPIILLLPWLSVNGTQIIAVLNEMSMGLGVSETSVKFISTMPNLTMIASSLLGGAIVGRRLSYKTHIMISALLMAASGTAPYLLNGFALILISRGIFGFAMGFMSSVSSSIIFSYCPPEKRARLVGYGMTSIYVSTVVYTLIAGVMGNLGWRYVFLIHLPVLIPLVGVAVLLPKKLYGAAVDGVKSLGGSRARFLGRLPALCLFFILTSVMCHLFFHPALINMPFILAEMGIDSPSASSIVISLNTVAAAVAGSLFGIFVRGLGRYVLPVAYGICAVGLFIAASASGLPQLIIGSMVAGSGFATTSMAMLVEVGTFVPKENMGLFSGVNMAASCVGVFCATPYVGLLARLGFKSSRTPLAVSGAGIVVLTCIILTYIIVSGRRAAAIASADEPVTR